MKSKIIKLIAGLAVVLGVTTSAVLPTYAVSSICDLRGQKDENGNLLVSEKTLEAAGCNGGSDQQLGNSIQAIINGIILVIGLVAVIVMVVGGVRYMTAAGDASKLQKAKATILYAVIGLIICVLSFAITNFVVGLVNDSQSPEPTLYNCDDGPQDTPCE